MRADNVLIVRGETVRARRAGRERELIETVRRAYETHAAVERALPHSSLSARRARRVK